MYKQLEMDDPEDIVPDHDSRGPALAHARKIIIAMFEQSGRRVLVTHEASVSCTIYTA